MHIESYILITDIPSDCISDCSGPGSADAAVQHWRQQLDLSVDRETSIRCLKGYFDPNCGSDIFTLE